MNTNIKWHTHSIDCEYRSLKNKQKPAIIWLTGLSGSGKSTIANALDKKLWEKGNRSYVIDGDNIRYGLCSDLGFSEKDRSENIRRAGEVAKLFVDSGSFAIVSLISPFEKDRQIVRQLVKKEQFIEVFVDSSLEECERRDVKGLYKKARNYEITNFTGIDSPYEPPLKPDIHLHNSDSSVIKYTNDILNFLKNRNHIKRK